MKLLTKGHKKIINNILIASGSFIVCTYICFLLDYFNINDLNFLIIYILGILVTAAFTNGYLYSSILSIVSVFGYNFFFIVPKLSFKINDIMYMVTFVLMFVVGLGISTVTFQLKKRIMQVAQLNMEKMVLKNHAEKEQVKATLLRSISHDLRTPLTTIKSGAELILDCPNLETIDKEEILNDIIYKSDWTIRLVENLLSLTRIDSEKLTVKKHKEVLEEIIPQAIRNINGIIGGREIHYDMPKDMIIVPMDATLIIQGVTNILTNAIKHTKDNGNLWIKIWDTGKNVIIRISNDGEPIEAKDLPHVFESYFTTGDKTSEGGIGLGLAICKLIVSAHGGQIEARNAENKVIFEFSLPTEE